MTEHESTMANNSGRAETMVAHHAHSHVLRGGATLGSNLIDADAIKENLERAHAAEARYVRQNALEMAIKISSGHHDYVHVLTVARAFEAYVRGETTAA